MKKLGLIAKDLTITVLMLASCFLLCLFIQNKFENSTLIPAIFVLGAFITSILTNGYLYGIISAILSVLAVNFAFTFPFFAFNFTVLENIISGAILLAVAVITCSLTTTIKRQEMQKAEGEKEKMRANLLRAISHDLRTPLTTIYGTSSVLLENYSDLKKEQVEKMLEAIKEDSAWLNRMVENLLSITKLDGDNVKIIKTETVLDELVDSILVKFAKRYPQQEVTVDLPEDFTVIPMDAILIEQVVINLLENAVEHAKGMTKLEFRVFTRSDKAVFEIEDNGCGIPEEIQKNIFSGQLYKNDTPSDQKKHNAGIGLSVCASIIKAHGGNIELVTPKEGGCIFRFILDMEDSANEQ